MPVFSVPQLKTLISGSCNTFKKDLSETSAIWLLLELWVQTKITFALWSDLTLDVSLDAILSSISSLPPFTDSIWWSADLKSFSSIEIIKKSLYMKKSSPMLRSFSLKIRY